MNAADVLARIEGRDASLWAEGNVSASRLGWLDVPRRMAAEASELSAWAAAIDQDHVVLLGMGGSSLGPAVLGAARAVGEASPGRPAGRRLTVCDTTDPETVADLDLSDAFVIVSSKSGTTLEPNVLLAYAWSKMSDPQRYAAITDPGTPLAGLAAERGFHRCFHNPPDIGGRYSVLSYFGLVPAVLAGYDVSGLCDAALSIDREEAIDLGLTIGSAALAGQDKLTIVVPESFRSFGLWIEQLIAESTGKAGRGCVPVPTTELETGPDRHIVAVDPGSPIDLGGEFFRWELATAAAGHVLEIDPFDEPNVAESKSNTLDALRTLPLPPLETVDPGSASGWLDATVRAGDYVSVQAYLPFGHDEALESLRRRLRDRLGGAAVTAGYGPRFLHSTGQLHKGGPASVVALQIVRDRDGSAERAGHRPFDIPIPGYPYTFGTLITAQAIGDRRSLDAHGRRVLTVAARDPGELAQPAGLGATAPGVAGAGGRT